MHRRIAPALAAATLLLAACGGAGPAPADPKDIVIQGLDAMADVETVHFVLSLDGTATIPDLGGEMNLGGTEASGDLSADGAARVEFAVPAMFGLSGEIIALDGASYTRTSLTGETWSKSDLDEDDPATGALDPTEQLDQVREFLDKEGVEVERLDDAECGEETCYAVRLTIPGEVLAEASDGGDVVPTDLVGEALVLDLLFDREDHWLTQLGTRIVAESVGELTLSLTFSAFNEPVEIEAPPADQVTEGGEGLPF
ncbi:MAG TPA: hypothetical protein VH859_04005 [Candidatus Limnocylindria bacterium]